MKKPYAGFVFAGKKNQFSNIPIKNTDVFAIFYSLYSFV